MKTDKSKQSEFIQEMLAKPITVHRILPTVRKYGNGSNTYHLEVRKQTRRHNTFYRSNDKKREYCIDVPDKDTMDRLAKDLAKILKNTTDAQIIVTKTYNEFVLHSKPKKLRGGHYHYRGYTIYDSSYESKRWVVFKGEHMIDYYDMSKTKQPSSPFQNTVFTTLGFCMENLDIHIDTTLKNKS